jgi:AraC-like DNA-binding protein
VLVHGAFDAHLDRIFIVGAETLNLKVPAFGCIADALCEISDVDLIVRTAETDPAGAAALLLEQMSPRPITPQDWPDLLAADLIEDPNRRLNDWADSHGLSRETISRGFGQIFGIPPAVFRSEVRSQRAFEQIVEGTNVLSRVLEVSGYSGLPQLSRAVRNLTGATPKSWLLKTSFKSDSFG